MDEIVFEVTQEGDRGFVAECLTESIVTQADDWETLRQNVKEAVAAYYFDSSQIPARIPLHHVRDDVLA
jgi:predicted RNase H-like HicB family nuclease